MSRMVLWEKESKEKVPRIGPLGLHRQRGIWRSEFLAEPIAALNKSGFPRKEGEETACRKLEVLPPIM